MQLNQIYKDVYEIYRNDDIEPETDIEMNWEFYRYDFVEPIIETEMANGVL